MTITTAVHDAIYANLARVRGTDVATVRRLFPRVDLVVAAYGSVLVEIWGSTA